MPDEEEKIEVAVGPDFKPPESTEVQPLSAVAEEPLPEISAEDLEPVEKWWATLESEDDLKAHERAKPWLEEVENSARQDALTQVQPLVTQNSAYFQQLITQGGRAAKEIERATRDGLLSDDVLDRWEELGARMGGVMRYVGQFEGVKRFVETLAIELDDDTLRKEFYPRIDLIEQGVTDEKIGRDLLQRLAKAAGGKESVASEKKGYDKGVTDGRKAAMEEMRARQRENNGPDLNRKTTAGGTALSPDRYKQMTHDERAKLTPQQIDAMTAELASQSRGLTR